MRYNIKVPALIKDVREIFLFFQRKIVFFVLFFRECLSSVKNRQFFLSYSEASC